MTSTSVSAGWRKSPGTFTTSVLGSGNSGGRAGVVFRPTDAATSLPTKTLALASTVAWIDALTASPYTSTPKEAAHAAMRSSVMEAAPARRPRPRTTAGR
jgi:hypothetical protein